MSSNNPDIGRLVESRDNAKGLSEVVFTDDAKEIFRSRLRDLDALVATFTKNLQETTDEGIKLPSELTKEHAQLLSEEVARDLDAALREELGKVIEDNPGFDLGELAVFGHLDDMLSTVEQDVGAKLNDRIQEALLPANQDVADFFEELPDNLPEEDRSFVMDAIKYLTELSPLRIVERITRSVPFGRVISKEGLVNFMDEYQVTVEERRSQVTRLASR